MRIEHTKRRLFEQVLKTQVLLRAIHAVVVRIRNVLVVYCAVHVGGYGPETLEQGPTEIHSSFIAYVEFFPCIPAHIPNVEYTWITISRVGTPRTWLMRHPEWVAETQSPYAGLRRTRSRSIIERIARHTVPRVRVEAEQLSVMAVEHLRPHRSHVLRRPHHALSQSHCVVRFCCVADIGAGVARCIAYRSQ